jgi:Arc/MetJ-type ribon-helix-helix transcriptional regulator
MSNTPAQKRINVWITQDLFLFMQEQIALGKYKNYEDMINKLLDREFQKTLIPK